ncbi:MAG: FG-GAP repeat domain-containing protein [Limisphaerales bacterium]
MTRPRPLRTGFLTGLAWLLACAVPAQPDPRRFEEQLLQTERVARGQELARRHCATCHQLPRPEQLDRQAWVEGVLPWMMGLLGLAPEVLPGGREGERIRRSGMVLPQAAMSRDDWWDIVAYYVAGAPTNRPASVAGGEPALWPGVQAQPVRVGGDDPQTLLVQAAPAQGGFWLSDGRTSELRLLTAAGEERAARRLPSPAVSLAEGAHGLVAACIGRFSPTEEALGSVVRVPLTDGLPGEPAVLLRDLPRPVHVAEADLNRDGRPDLVVSMFGWYSGRFAWFEALAEGGYREHVLLPRPGALRAEIRDLTGDGRPDLAVLVAQATEALFLYVNDGRGGFLSRIALERPPSHGHTSFELVDFDADGRPDLLVTNGDAGDYPARPRPDHGVRVYLDRGGLRFEEALFLPLPGACRAVARDLDGDGDLDLAAIAYYPDFSSRRDGGLALWRQDAPGVFTRLRVDGAALGRWLSLDAGDLDGDGRQELILGSARQGPGRTAYVPADLDRLWRTNGLAALVLRLP